MIRAAPTTGGRRWLLPVLLGTGVVAAAGGAALGVLAFANSAAVYTDGDTIRVPVGVVEPGEILWQGPAALAAPMLSPGDDYEPRAAWDGLTVYFSRGRAGENADLYIAQRTPDGWTEPQPLAELNTPADELGPSPSFDGQSLYFYSDRAGGLGGYDLWVAHRSSSGWLPAVPLGPRVNSPFNEYGPSVSPDGRTLYFASNRPPPGEAPTAPHDAWPATLREDPLRRTYDLYAAAVTPGGFGEACPLAALNTPANEGAPCASPLGEFLYFASDRPGGAGGFDLYRARLLRGQLQPPINLGPQINTAANELDPALAQLGFALYFSSDRAPGLGGATESATSSPHESPAAPRYHLYYAQAREVFRESEPRNPVAWAALWLRVWPYLLWLLVALLALLLLWKLIGDMRDKRLSLLARCLLASLMAHALLLFVFSFWRVSAVLADALRASSPIRVGLVSTAGVDPLAEQVVGSWTTVAAPQPDLPPVARANLDDAPRLAPLPAPPRTERALSVEAPPREPAPMATDAPLVLDAPAIPALPVAPAPEPSPALRAVVALPDAERPVTAEPLATHDPVPQPATIGRAAPTLAPSPTQDQAVSLDVPPVEIQAPDFGGETLIATSAQDAALPPDPPAALAAAASSPLPPTGPTAEPLALPAEERVASSSADETAGAAHGPQPGQTQPPDVPRFAGAVGAADRAALEPAAFTPAAPLAAPAPAWAPLAIADARAPDERPAQVPVALPALAPTSRPVDLALPELEESAVFADSQRQPERADDADYALSADVAGGPNADDRATSRRPALRIRGLVRDARSGEPLPQATVQLDAGGAAPLELEADNRGRFALALEDVPDSFVVSAMSRGYVPQSTGLTAEQLSGRSVAIEFSLSPASQDVVLIEPAPELHHLGNDRFEGRINSRFERRAEGRSIRFSFRVGDDALPAAPHAARLTMLTRGVQCEHPVWINGELLPSGLAESPPDGRFGPAEIEFDAGLLRAGDNSIEVRSRSCWGDIDDFEFVNMQIHLGP